MNGSQSLRLVSLLLGQEVFQDLLIEMPDSFFSLSEENKNWVWDQLLGEVNQGVEDAVTLARLASSLVAAG